MDHLLGSVRLDRQGEGEPRAAPGGFDDGRIKLHVGRKSGLDVCPDGIYHNRTTDVVCALFGYISNLEELRRKHGTSGRSAPEIIEELYSNGTSDPKADLDGIFTIALFDRGRRKGLVFQDRHGSNTPLYYRIADDRLLFSTSLKSLLAECSLSRELDSESVYHFLHYRYVVPFKRTLLKGVSKLVPGHCMHVDDEARSVTVEKMAELPEPSTTSVEPDDMLRTVESCTASLLEQTGSRAVAMTLSGGYDSNLILHNLRRLTDSPLTALTIGGKLHNEIPQAAAILEHYDGVAHIRSIIPERIVQSLPDIVWRTEGYVFSHAVFLQYELATLLSRVGFSSIFLGDGADQQLEYGGDAASAMDRIKRGVKFSPIGDLYLRLTGRKVEYFLSRFRRRARNEHYSIFLDLILKKNGIMLNSFGIQGLYPFMNRGTAIAARAFGAENVSKDLYKQEVIRLLGPSISEHITKQFGTTDIGYLFGANSDLLMKVLKSDLVKRFLNRSQIRTIANDDLFQPFILQLLYIYLFDELFIKESKGADLADDGLDRPLADFL